MKRLILLAIAILAVLSLAGCSGNGGEENGNGDGDGNGTEAEQWAAYAFDQTVTPASGGTGKIETFTIDSTYSEDGKIRQFEIEGTYLGKETTQVETAKMVVNQSTYEVVNTTVSTSLECYKVKHHITVVQDETGADHPAWAEITVWIPTDSLETTTQYFWIYPKATYVDSDENSGEWSYFLTDAMQSEMQDPPAGTTVLYTPIVEGEFYGYDEWTFYGLYGWAWIWFGAFAEGGQQELTVGSWSSGLYSYTCTKDTESIGSYSFSAWTVEASWTYEGETAGYKGVFSHDLPLPIYLKVGSTSEGSSNYFEYTLTDVQLQ